MTTTTQPPARTRDNTGIFLSRDLKACKDELHLRLLVTAAGLTRVCQLKRCRRRKRCMGLLAATGLACTRLHHGLLRQRSRSAIRVLELDDGSGAIALEGNHIVLKSKLSKCKARRRPEWPRRPPAPGPPRGPSFAAAEPFTC